METLNGVHPRVGISAWSFHKRFGKSGWDYPQFFAAARGTGVESVELNSPFFHSLERPYLEDLKAAADSLGVRIVNIAVDDWQFDLSSHDDANRREAVQRSIAWLDAAVLLNCPNVRNNSGGDDFAQCTESFQTLAREAKDRGRRILIEAHGGFSSDTAQLLPLIQPIHAEYPDSIGLVPDFGNVTETPERDRYAQIQAMAPYAAVVHPKTHDFDERGRQAEWDIERLVRIVRQAGFRGHWIIEFEGNRDEDFVGVRKSIALISESLRA